MSGLDMSVMRQIGSASGFALQHDWLLERILHEGMRQAATVAFAILWLWALWPKRWRSRDALPTRERLTVAGLVVLSLVAVNLIKNASLTSCPWDWRAFGGTADPVAHWRLGVPDGGPGRCFPGGHASSGFAFFAICLPWLMPPQSAGQRRQAIGLRWLAAVLLAGFVAGAVQTLRGAHPPSHTLWTLLICAGVSITGWRALHT
ncbi:phosphatase PAP2 family protein [Hydrogenophaga sp.]|uniref:phosphatase PAP2 family protein n=1 Tax=Hydrogenophaga sp. TaxID=1904254 RepID=UPI00261B73F4|nr:phosphatase PAP2 family protein [Hydrogenophaga sp.]MCW5654917.1 phosphatase PAP2 family protein [Hydrogenophaga sp.]